jgi:hypothetical protein
MIFKGPPVFGSTSSTGAAQPCPSLFWVCNQFLVQCFELQYSRFRPCTSVSWISAASRARSRATASWTRLTSLHFCSVTSVKVLKDPSICGPGSLIGHEPNKMSQALPSGLTKRHSKAAVVSPCRALMQGHCFTGTCRPEASNSSPRYSGRQSGIFQLSALAVSLPR